jgi:WD repeat-containing protein 90
MPKEINFRKPKTGTWAESYVIKYYPISNAKESTKLIDHFQSEAENARKTFVDNKTPKIASYLDIGQDGDGNTQGAVTDLERVVVFRENLEQEGQAQEAGNAVLSPNPILKLEKIVGFTGRTCPDIRFSKSEADRIYYATGNMIVTTKVDSFTQQEFLQGHNTPVTCMELSHDGKILASCQEGENPMLRLWRTDTNKCTGKFNVGVTEARCISFACQGYTMCVIGTDKLYRDEILIVEAYYKEDGVHMGAKIIARQISEFNILTIKFSPIDCERLVSCGKENIRFWRIKNQHLPGGAVVLNHHARDTIFTVFDFDFGKIDQPKLAARDDIIKRVLVGSKHGYLYQVNYDTRQLESVFKIHDLSICSISVSAGFCVTGSQDQYIRVWPLDFSEFFLEAQHESIIIALDISLDGLKVACGTSANSLSILDLTTQNYKTLLRSHSDTIVSLQYQEESHLLLSLSKDCTIRIWDDYNLDQLYEFNFSKDDDCNCIAVHPKRNIFAGGFSSGVFRIFSIEKVEVLSEHKYHNQPLEDIKFSSSGKYIGMGDSKGFYTLLNCENNFEFVKTFECKCI